MKNIFIILFILVLSSCSSGGFVMLNGAAPKKARAIETIELFLKHPKKSYKVIALLNSSADTQRQLYGSSSKAKSNALNELKKQAAKTGADGIIDIIEEVFINGEQISSTAWGNANINLSGNTNGNSEVVNGSASASSFGFGQVFTSREYIYKGKAIKFK